MQQNRAMELLAEADRRGLLSGQKKALFDEAVRRGLVGKTEPPNVSFGAGLRIDSGEQAAGEMVAPEQIVQAQATPQTPMPGDIKIDPPTPQDNEPSKDVDALGSMLDKHKNEQDMLEAIRKTPIHGLMQLALQSRGGPSTHEVIKQAVMNTPESAVEFGKIMVQPVLHPQETFNGIKSLVMGVYQKVVGADHQPDGATVDAVAQYYSNRYGDVPSFKNAVAEDPVGVAADISLLLNGAGGAMKAGKLAGLDVLADAGKSVSNIGNAIEPLNVLKQSTVGLASKVLPEKVPAALYESGAKLSTRKTFTPKDRQRAINTALENGFLPKEGEISKIWTKISENSDKVDSIIDQATSQGGTISKMKLLAEIPELAQQPHPQMIRRNKTLEKLSGDLLEAFPDEIPVEQVQQLKRTIHKELANFYQNTAPKPAIMNEFNAAVAKAAMHELETLYPELQSINKQTSDYLHLVKALEQSAKRVANKNVVSLDTVIKGAAGYSVGDIGGMIGGLALGVLDRDIVKAKLAITLRKAKMRGFRPKNAASKNIVYGAGNIETQDEQ